MTDQTSELRPEREASALEINLRRTASQIVIPETQRVLLEATRESVGVHEKTRLLLEEFNHPYVNWGHVLSELRSYAIGNFYFHNEYEKGDEAIRVLTEIFFTVGEQCCVPDLRVESYRALLRYLEKVVEGSDGKLERNRPVVEAAVRVLLDRFQSVPVLAGVLSGGVRRLLRAAGERDADWERPLLLELMKISLGETYRIWLDLPDPAGWVDSGAPDRLPLLKRIRHEAIRDYRERLKAAGEEDFDELTRNTGSLPDQAVMENLYLRAADEIERHFEGWSGYTKKVLFLLKILDTQLLRQIRDPALRSINRALSRALRMEERPHAAGFIDAAFDSFGRGWLQHDSTVLDCIHTIAVEVLRSEDERLIQKVIDRILEHGFETPEIGGVNELWQYEVNPAHAKNIRLWMDLIARNPFRMKRLLSALIFHLRAGGVFVSDTDLFQRDVANLLNADIQPVYNLVKQLGKLFPIYFREIGAEGELRRVSTRVDEIGLRRDSVVHFLRKQCHVESSSRLIAFAEDLLRYWTDGDAEPLRSHLPEEIFSRLPDEKEHLDFMGSVLARVAERTENFPSGLLEKDLEEIREWVESGPEPAEGSREKAIQMIRVYQLLDRKYNIGPRGALEGLENGLLVDAESIRRLRDHIEANRFLDAVTDLMDILEKLKKVILDPEPAESREDIYRKRHIAAGIPSMYGRFLNRKVEALGLTYRLEKLTEILFERLIEEENLRYLTKRGIARVSQWLVLLRRALWVDGISSRGLGSRIDMLERGLELGNLTIDQFINIFQFTSRTIREITRYTLASLNESDLERLAPILLKEAGEKPDRGRVHVMIEAFFRDQISSCFALQILDNLVSRVLSTLTFESETFVKSTRNLLMSYDIDKCFVPIHTEHKSSGDPILLGFKGSFLRRMAGFGYPVPAGFIVTTEVYRTYEALSAFKDLRAHTLSILQNQLREMERRTGRTFGDPQSPLLLSVRSGAAVSMPGMMDTFLDVGINESIAEGLSRRPRFSWAAWDSYRRFLQSWGLSYGVPQEVFDRIFEDYKTRYSVEKKALFTAEQIREVALACRRAITDHDVEIVDEPFRQLRHCIERVLFSWDSERARHYRKEMKIADDWGTAVVVQAMVYGNLDERSGTGVLFTQNPRRKSGGVSLYGDFVLRSQGEDVVRGLVETHPLTEEQRNSQARGKISLESAFPEVYGELLRIAEDLVVTRGFNHQEIEFTFEKDEASSLYVLQARDIVTSEESEIPAFVSTTELEANYITSGIGVGGGALSGRVAHNEKDIRELWEQDPDGTIILIRPNTVPEDIHMIFRADGLLTSRGGATSHAAVAAQSIGRTCVVGCRALHVDERKGETVVGDKVIRSGDVISINGYNGAVYLGKHEIKPSVRLDNI